MRRMITNKELAAEVEKQLDTAGAVSVTGTQTITGAKTFTDIAGAYFPNGINIQATNGATKRLVIEPVYYMGENELEIGWMYLVVPWSSSDVSFTLTNTTEGDITKTANTANGLGFINIWKDPGKTSLIVQSTYTNEDTGRPLTFNVKLTDDTKVYFTQSLGLPNWGLRMKWVD